jgi:hypothetical protein
MGIALPICCVTGRIAGDRFACGDCDPCLSAHVVPPVVKQLMAERDEFADKYEAAMSEQSEVPAPPCEVFYMDAIHKHPRYPSGHCVVCGAEAHEGCKHELYAAWREDDIDKNGDPRTPEFGVGGL